MHFRLLPSPPKATVASRSPSDSVYALAGPLKSSYQMVAASASCGCLGLMTTESMRGTSGASAASALVATSRESTATSFIVAPPNL